MYLFNLLKPFCHSSLTQSDFILNVLNFQEFLFGDEPSLLDLVVFSHMATVRQEKEKALSNFVPDQGWIATIFRRFKFFSPSGSNPHVVFKLESSVVVVEPNLVISGSGSTPVLIPVYLGKI